MNRDIGRKLIEQCKSFDEIFNRITELSDEVASNEDRKKIRHAAAEALCGIYEGIVQTVIEKYPDLRPPDAEETE